MGGAQAWLSGGVATAVRKMYEDKGRGYQPFNDDLNKLRKLGAYLPDWYWVVGSDSAPAPSMALPGTASAGSGTSC